MFNYLATFRNHFLQKELKFLNPESIGDMIHQEFREKTNKRDKCKHPWNDECKPSTYFNDRAQLAYGWFALPKLLDELCSNDRLIHWRAINSLSEFLMNPLNAQRAIEEFDIVRRCHNVFLRYRLQFYVEHYKEVERLMVIFRILSIYLNGAVKIAHKPGLIVQFYKMIHDGEKHMETAAVILRNLTDKPEVLLYLLNETDALDRVTEIFQSDPCKPYFPSNFWTHLAHFLEVSPDRGIEKGFFELLHQRIIRRIVNYHRANLKCFALLLRCEEGQRRFDDIDGIKMLYDILKDKDIFQFDEVVFALMHGVMSKRTLWRCREFTDLPDVLMCLAMSTSHGRMQLHCLQCLRQMGELPCIKKYIKGKYLETLARMSTCNAKVNCDKDELIDWLKREPYHSHQ